MTYAEYAGIRSAEGEAVKASAWNLTQYVLAPDADLERSWQLIAGGVDPTDPEVISRRAEDLRRLAAYRTDLVAREARRDQYESGIPTAAGKAKYRRIMASMPQNALSLDGRVRFYAQAEVPA